MLSFFMSIGTWRLLGKRDIDKGGKTMMQKQTKHCI